MMAEFRPCAQQGFENQLEARRFAKNLRRVRRIHADAKRCEHCSLYHVVLSNGMLDPMDVDLLLLLAQGLWITEIAATLGCSKHVVENRTRALREHFDAMNTANLVATAILLRAFDTSKLLDDERWRNRDVKPTDSTE